MPDTPKYEVIPAQVWLRDDGQKASIYGAVPFVNEEQRARWKIADEGWTVRNPITGIVGVGQKPWATEAEAQAFADTHVPSSISPGD